MPYTARGSITGPKTIAMPRTAFSVSANKRWVNLPRAARPGVVASTCPNRHSTSASVGRPRCHTTAVDTAASPTARQLAATDPTAQLQAFLLGTQSEQHHDQHLLEIGRPHATELARARCRDDARRAQFPKAMRLWFAPEQIIHAKQHLISFQCWPKAAKFLCCAPGFHSPRCVSRDSNRPTTPHPLSTPARLPRHLHGRIQLLGPAGLAPRLVMRHHQLLPARQIVALA